MTFKEFLETRPEDVKKAKACKTIDEFKKLVDSFGITYENHAELQQGYDFIKNNQNQLSDDDLDNVAGGAAYKHDAKDLYYSKDGKTVLSEGSGKKV